MHASLESSAVLLARQRSTAHLSRAWRTWDALCRWDAVQLHCHAGLFAPLHPPLFTRLFRCRRSRERKSRKVQQSTSAALKAQALELSDARSALSEAGQALQAREGATPFAVSPSPPFAGHRLFNLLHTFASHRALRASHPTPLAHRRQNMRPFG